ncbi:MAG TPA: hypothetical protein VIG24_12820 [Acidimicrobiia bacterium]
MNRRDMASRAREMEKDAREIESVEETLAFLEQHPEQPKITVEYPGFQSDGARAARMLAELFAGTWDDTLGNLRSQLRARKKELEDRWD